MLVVNMVSSPAWAQRAKYEEPATAATMAFDAAIVRPLSLVATVVGTALFVGTLPLSALGGNTGEAGKLLVVKPAKTTFTRPLGHFD